MNPKKPKIVAGRVKKSPSFEQMKTFPPKVFLSGGVSTDFNTTTENIREVSRTLNYNILEDTSFIYIPNSYGENRNFNQYPILRNLLTFSEDYSNAIWTKNLSTATPNTIANPINGLVNGFTYSKTATPSTFSRRLSYPLFISGTYTLSIFAKKIDYEGLSIGLTDSTTSTDNVVFNLETGNLISVVSGLTYSSESFGNGWFRFSVTSTNLTSIIRVDFTPTNLSGSPVFNDAIIRSVYLWGAQLESGTTATTYQRTTDAITDFNFTRATTSRVVNNQGVIDETSYNLFQRSEEYDNAIWAKNLSTITANTITAPNGTITADKIYETANSGIHAVTQGFVYTSVNIFNLSTYAKAAERTFIRIANQNSTFATIFDLTTGTVISGSGSIEDVGNGWYRCCTTFYNTLASDTYFLEIMSNSSTWTYLGDPTKGLYIWGTQLTLGATPKPYLRTTNRLNVPKLDYSRNLLEPSLLNEPQRTNLVLQSEDFTQPNWSKFQVTILPNIISAPNETLSADKIIETSSNSQHFVGVALTRAVNDIYTCSVYLKAAERSEVYLVINENNFTFPFAIFNLATGTIGLSGGNVNPRITYVGDGWYRCSITRTTVSAGTSIYQLNGVLNNLVSYIGTVGDGYYAWGFQIEQGANPTTYIPTTTGTVTRNIDTSFVDLSNNNILNPSAFTLYWEGFLNDGQPLNMCMGLSNFSNGTTSGNQLAWYSGLRPLQIISGVTTSGIDCGLNNSHNKFAIQYSAGTANFYLNGTNIWPNRSVPVFNYRYLILNSGNSTYSTDKIILWNRTLSSGECKTLTYNIPFKNIVAYYNLNSNANDLISSSHNGVSTNINYSNSGKTSTCATFDGSSSFIQVPQSTDFDFSTPTGDLPFSVSFWVNFSLTSTYSHIINKDNGTSNIQYSIRKGSGTSNILEVVLVTSGGNYKLWAYTSNILTNGVWYHVVVTYDGLGNDSSVKTYLNNVLITGINQNSGVYTKMPITSQPLTIGTRGNNTNYFKGSLDEIAIWKNYILSPSEINTIYNKGLSAIPLI